MDWEEVSRRTGFKFESIKFLICKILFKYLIGYVWIEVGGISYCC